MRTLYHTPLSPDCRKIRILLREKELDFELMQENFWERRPEFFALNPAGEVPVLLEPDGEAICGNYAIMEYLEEAYRDNNRRFIGSSIGERAEVRRITEWFDKKFDREVTQNIVFEKVFKRLLRLGEPQSDALRAGKKNMLYHMDYIAFLTQEHRFLAGDMVTIADMTAAAHFSTLDYLGDAPWEHNVKAKEWYALMKSRPSVRLILTDRLPALHPPEHYENPDF